MTPPIDDRINLLAARICPECSGHLDAPEDVEIDDAAEGVSAVAECVSCGVRWAVTMDAEGTTVTRLSPRP